MPLPGISEIRSEIDQILDEFTDRQALSLKAIDHHLIPVGSALREFVLDGGKRFRPIFAYLGYLGAGGTPSNSIIRASAALELVHVCALIHDDVMDGSDSRRNRPALHKNFERLHLEENLSGEPSRFGVAAAILLGDLALAWSDQLISESKLSVDQLERSAVIFHSMRAELMAGQYLDVLEGALNESNLARSRKIALYKSGRYSIERPLRFGAALASEHDEIHEAYSKFGIPLGEAFQLRDDILGIFGDPEVTGKPAGDDIREGKRTVLMALTLSRLDSVDKRKLETALGDPSLDRSQVAEIQRLIEDSGALQDCENLIAELLRQADQALTYPGLSPEVVKMLRTMALAATKRES